VRLGWSRVWAAIATTVGGATALAWIVPAWATADAPRPEEATLGPRLALLVIVLACGAAVYLLLPASPAPRTAASGRPSMSLAHGDRVSWTGVIVSRALEIAVTLMCVVFLAVLATALFSRQGAAWVAVVVLFVATLSTFLLVPVRLTVDRRGIRLVSVLLRVPLIRVPLENIDTVTADAIDPMSWGGWGYRVSGAGIAYVARRGPGIVITRRSGGAVAITVDAPEQPAAVANGLIAARAQA
jgi:hypothetical protein